MSKDQNDAAKNSLSFAAIGWAVSLAVTAVALTTGVITIVQFLKEKSVTLEAEFFPSEIAFVGPYADPRLREADLSDTMQNVLGAASSHEALAVQGKLTKLSIADLANKIAVEDAKQTSPLARLPLPPTGQMRVVITNSGQLPANKVRVFVPDADIYMIRKDDRLVPLPHNEDGAEIGQINQGRNVELFAFTRYGYKYGGGYCLFECDLTVAHEDGLGNVAIRTPRSLFEAVMSQGIAFFMLFVMVMLVGLVGTIAMVASGFQQAYGTIIKQRPASTEA